MRGVEGKIEEKGAGEERKGEWRGWEEERRGRGRGEGRGGGKTNRLKRRPKARGELCRHNGGVDMH